jgi:hypothetical protein
MKPATHEILGIAKRRGFRLRCFLGVGFAWVVAFGLTARITQAQITILKPLHVRHVQGYVTDEKGNAVASVVVQLFRDGKPVLGTRADNTGWFQIEGARGRYLLQVSAGSPELGREVAVGTNLLTLFCRKTLYVMVRPNQPCDDCSIRVFTSRGKFFNAVWQNTGHYY